MNTGAFGENFPYSNFHDLNMDWIIKIAKDFLDQYTHIQEVIESGLQQIDDKTLDSIQQLNDKYDELESALDDWYTEHQEDISNELATAISNFNTEVSRNITSFNTLVDNKVQSALESIPADYTEMYNNYAQLESIYERDIVAGHNAFNFSRFYNSNEDYTYNENGTLTFGNSDYGFVSTGVVHLEPGTYVLCGMPRVISNAYVYLSTSQSYAQAFETNATTSEKTIYINNPVDAYLGVAITGSPVSSGFTIRLYLNKTLPMTNKDNFNSYNGMYNINNITLNKYVKTSKNVFKNTNYTTGKYINPNGSLGSNAGYKLSDYFPIKPNMEYLIENSGIDICFYDNENQYISGLEPSANSVIKSPNNAFYARASTNVDPSLWRITEGTTTSTEPYYTPYIEFDTDVLSPFYKGELITNKGGCTPFYEGYLESYNLGFSENTKYAEVIQLFDALMANAEQGYITKNTIGTAEGTDEQGNTYNIYEYVFKPRTISSNIDTKVLPKILINCAIHGFEKNSTFGMYCVCYDIVHNWKQNEFLNTLRNLVEIHIVPVSNPWGFDRNVYGNANGVNINRNFPCANWTAGEDTGAAPLDQSETQALASWLQGNPDMLIFIDTHTNGRYYVEEYREANANMAYKDTNDAYYNKLFTAIKRHMERQTIYLPTVFNTLTPPYSTTIGRYQDQTGIGQTKGYSDLYVTFYLETAIAMTLEGCNGININDGEQISRLSPDSVKLNSIIFGNMIQEILCEYSK